MGVRCWMMGVRCWMMAVGCWVLGVSALLTSCQEGRDAGDLLGQWRLTDTQYISFSGSIVSFRNGGNEVFGNFQHVGDSLFIQCYSIYGKETDVTMVENEFGFKPFGNIRVKIDALDSDHLLLSKDAKWWSLRKY